jgi:chromosome segregation ATPase
LAARETGQSVFAFLIVPLARRFVSSTPSVHEAPSSGVRDWLAEIAAGQAELDRFLEDVFTRVEGLLAEFGRRQQACDIDRGRREAELRAERERLQEAAARQPDPPSAAATAQQELICQMVAELQQGRDALKEVIAAAEGQVSGWSQTGVELAKARDAFLRHANQARSGEPAAQAESRRALEEQVRRQAEDLSQVQQERATLERELEIVRHHAAELSETLSQQGRQMLEERERWSDELKRIRRVLENVAQRQLAQPAAEPRPAVAAVDVPTGAERTPADEPAGDPVLDSVITQFETLQKDLARRRKAAAG